MTTLIIDTDYSTTGPSVSNHGHERAWVMPTNYLTVQSEENSSYNEGGGNITGTYAYSATLQNLNPS